MEHFRRLLSSVSEAMNNEEMPSDTRQPEYNIFHVLEVAEKELVMCRFLADLLNPEGRHGYGILFLKTFFQDVLKEWKIDDTLLAHTKVDREYEIDALRRIDLVIHNTQFFIPIEVKIYAGEQEGQCYDYHTYAKAFHKDTRIVYLTRYGNKPSEYSRKSKNGIDILPEDKIKCISWDTDICRWLTSLFIQLEEPVKSLLGQYIEAIRVFTDSKEKKFMEKSLEILFESTDFFSAGIQVEKSMKAAKLKLIRLVFDDFKKEMDPIAPRYGLEMESKFHYYSYQDIKRHEKFYDNANSTFPGLNYIVKKAKFPNCGLQIWFRIEIEENLIAGLTLFDTEAESQYGYAAGNEVESISAEMINETSKYVDKNVIMPAGWWLTWCYPNGKCQDGYYADVPDFKGMNECAVQLADSKKRTEFVRKSVEVFEEHILKYLI